MKKINTLVAKFKQEALLYKIGLVLSYCPPKDKVKDEMFSKFYKT